MRGWRRRSSPSSPLLRPARCSVRCAASPAARMAEDVFAALFAEVTADGRRFGHREHVHLTWLAVRRCGMPAAINVVSAGIRRTARYAGAPQKYHATVSRAWVEV